MAAPAGPTPKAQIDATYKELKQFDVAPIHGDLNARINGLTARINKLEECRETTVQAWEKVDRERKGIVGTMSRIWGVVSFFGTGVDGTAVSNLCEIDSLEKKLYEQLKQEVLVQVSLLFDEADVGAVAAALLSSPPNIEELKCVAVNLKNLEAVLEEAGPGHDIKFTENEAGERERSSFCFLLKGDAQEVDAWRKIAIQGINTDPDLALAAHREELVSVAPEHLRGQARHNLLVNFPNHIRINKQQEEAKNPNLLKAFIWELGIKNASDPSLPELDLGGNIQDKGLTKVLAKLAPYIEHKPKADMRIILTNLCQLPDPDRFNLEPSRAKHFVDQLASHEMTAEQVSRLIPPAGWTRLSGEHEQLAALAHPSKYKQVLEHLNKLDIHELVPLESNEPLFTQFVQYLAKLDREMSVGALRYMLENPPPVNPVSQQPLRPDFRPLLAPRDVRAESQSSEPEQEEESEDLTTF